MSEPSRASHHGLHATFIKQRLPDWVEHLAAPHIKAMSRGRDPVQSFTAANPELFARAAPELRQALLDSQARRQASHHTLAATLQAFKGISEFARPLLTEALRKKFGLDVDVNQTRLYHLHAPNRKEEQTLLQAALRNFEAGERFDEVALQETSALAPAGALEKHYLGEPDRSGTGPVRYRIRDKLPIDPGAFAQLCRELDLGRQYQDHLRSVFEAPDTADRVREQMVAAYKDNLRVQTHLAHIKSNISDSACATLLSILDGTPAPTLDGHPVVYSQLQLLGSDLSEILIIGPSVRNLETLWYDLGTLALPLPAPFVGQNGFDTRIIVYIPGDPVSPVKEHASLSAFVADLSRNLRTADYQRFFSGFVAHDQSADFFRRLKGQLKVRQWNPSPVYPGPPYNPDAFAGGIYEEVWNPQVDLRAVENFLSTEAFHEVYDRHLSRMKANARLLAVPVAEVDHKAWIARLEHFAQWGLNVLNVAAFFVPGLGEVMLGVTAVQLSLEVYHGIQAWQVGDAAQAWGYLESFMLNAAFMAALAGAGAATRAPAIKPDSLVNRFVRVELPNGQSRLWKPDLTPYRSDVVLDESRVPNAQGQYEIEGRVFIRQEGQVYEKTWDPSIEAWRIKHPTDPTAYQPVLKHNQAGAWRHAFERPLEWDRPTLLRRMGPVAEPFTDPELEQIADISGIDEDALRKMHVDHEAPPPLLAEAFRLFKTDRQVNQLIEQARAGEPVPDNRYNYVLPMVIDMPGWPFGRVIEVFEDAALTVKLDQYGVAPGLVRPAIRVTRAQVASSQLPQLILTALDEQEIIRLLGDEGARVDSERVAVFRAHIADFLQTQKASIFDSIHLGTEPSIPEMSVLRRNMPGLCVDAAQTLLNDASDIERASLRDQRRIPLRLAEEARVLVQQGRLNRACAGLYLDSLGSADSDRLVLHALEKLPGWSGSLRVEVREGHVGGRLLDSIGSETAPARKYLVRRGNQFQAYDDDGNTLNSVPRTGRNLFASVMHALPDDVRQGLALPHVGQAAELRIAVRDYAVGHRTEMSRVLGQQPIKPRFRAPQPGYTGYLLSGRGSGVPRLDASLVARVRDTYPNLSDAVATEFVHDQFLSGKTDQQVYTLLNNRARELQALSDTLDTWVAASGRSQASRRALASRLIDCWRSTPWRGRPSATYLDLSGAEGLTPLAADFSHVRALKLNLAELTESSVAGLLRQFPEASRLDLWMGPDMALSESITGQRHITELRLEGLFSPALQASLSAMPHLETLSICARMEALDVSALPQLRSLTLKHLMQWPDGVLQLEHLQNLDLRGSPISTLPEPLLGGHERVWRGLTMDWARLDHQSFLSAYRFLRGNPAHLADIEQVAQTYWQNVLKNLVLEPDQLDQVFFSRPRTRVVEGFAPRALDEGVSTEAMLERVRQLREEKQALIRQLTEWWPREVRVDRQRVDIEHRLEVANRLLGAWRDGIRLRFGPEQELSTQTALRSRLYLSGGRLGDLPELSAATYSHIRHLELSGARVAEPVLSAFLRNFPQLRQLNLDFNGLVELPSVIDELPQLTELFVNVNELRYTPVLQARLSQLNSLEVLGLRGNPLEQLDVSTMTRLRVLDLGATALHEWPAGVEGLSSLRRLDLERSSITSIPPALRSGHDALVAMTSLRGCPLTEDAFMHRQQILERYYGRSLASDRSNWGTPQYYAPVDSESMIESHLLPALPKPEPGQALTAIERLSELDPVMGREEATGIIDRLRGQGLDAAGIEAQLSAWREAHEALTGTLNQWILTNAHDVAGVRVSALSRRRAVDAILGCWRQDIRAGLPEAGDVLDLADMPLGDLPALPWVFNQVGTLNLRAVKLSEQGSDGFISAFPAVRRLVLDKNNLDSLPAAINGMQRLEQLEASGNELLMSESLQRQLDSLPGLKHLDLSDNTLNGLDVRGLARLEILDLKNNNLTDWPVGALQSTTLKSLNLSGNRLTTIYEETLWANEPRIRAQAINLSDNPLTQASFVALRNVLMDADLNLGYHRDELDLNVWSSSEGELTSDEDLGASEPEGDEEGVSEEQQLGLWLSGKEADLAEKTAQWNALKAQNDSRAFFHLLSQLQVTQDFAVARDDLTRRVWKVIEAAGSDEQLRKELFIRARSGYTCGDGRILLFSDLEVKVLEFNALKAAPKEEQGRELLKLARGMFRLGKVEEIALAASRRNPRVDPAEIRLAYRIGLTERLELPGQPADMLYQNLSRVMPEDINAAYAEVIEAEHAPDFMTQLLDREYWVRYLKRKYPAQFEAVQRRRDVKFEALEARHPEFDEGHFNALTALKQETTAEEGQLVLTLSQRERAEIGI
ncbi:NEL-type E3 ubiquitin ligase domain-containing protein [Pseudomonas taetrolens]|uniref:NEL-type E3 ubiquitin ligase domain-containing protein n=1 Tax=Pseudomonas taetrolens TaxID=47884 RepID=UPI003F956779